MRGRKPKATHIKLLAGNPGRRPLNNREPKPARVIPAPPEHLPPECLLHWRRFAAYFAGMGVLTEVDGPGLEQLCSLYQEIIELREVIATEGRSYATINRSGARMIRPHPAVAQLADADRRFRGWWSDFGGTPTARVRVQADSLEDETAELLFGSPGRYGA
jgi:P27 family predicted phage terminase small subunit